MTRVLCLLNLPRYQWIKIIICIYKITSSLLQDTDIYSYRRPIGRLIYLTVTRPDLAYSVQVLSQFIAKPRLDHHNAAYKVVRYLKGSPGQGLFMAANAVPKLTAFCDSDWGGSHLRVIVYFLGRL